MNIHFKFDPATGRKIAVIEYEPHDWESIGRQLLRLGMQEVETTSAFGDQRLEHPIKYYKEPTGQSYTEFLFGNPETYRGALSAVDAITEPIFGNKRFNLAIFRAEPFEHNEVIGRTLEIPTVVEQKDIKDIIQKAHQKMMGAASEIKYHVHFNEINPDELSLEESLELGIAVPTYEELEAWGENHPSDERTLMRLRQAGLPSNPTTRMTDGQRARWWQIVHRRARRS